MLLCDHKKALINKALFTLECEIFEDLPVHDKRILAGIY